MSPPRNWFVVSLEKCFARWFAAAKSFCDRIWDFWSLIVSRREKLRQWEFLIIVDRLRSCANSRNSWFFDVFLCFWSFEKFRKKNLVNSDGKCRERRRFESENLFRGTRSFSYFFCAERTIVNENRKAERREEKWISSESWIQSHKLSVKRVEKRRRRICEKFSTEKKRKTRRTLIFSQIDGRAENFESFRVEIRRFCFGKKVLDELFGR